MANMTHSYNWQLDWECFKRDLPHQTEPYSKKNWGSNNHSLCSYQGKLKPAIGYHLTKTFVPFATSVFLSIRKAKSLDKGIKLETRKALFLF